MGDVFISYAQEDRKRVQSLVRALEQAGWSVWWDRSIRPGSTWDNIIEQAIEEARCIIVVWTQASVKSDWVRVEADEGRQRGILVPVLLDDVKIPLAFRRMQSASLIEWSGSATDPLFLPFRDAVAHVLGAPGTRVASRPTNNAEMQARSAVSLERDREERPAKHEDKQERVERGEQIRQQRGFFEITTSRHMLHGHKDTVTAFVLAADGKLGVSASRDKTLKVWDLDNLRPMRTLQGHSDWVTCVAVTPDGERAISASLDGNLILWNVTSGKVEQKMRVHSGWWLAWVINGVALEPSGELAVSASADKTIKLWDLKTGRCLHILKGHTDSVEAVAVTPDGARVVSASKDKTLKLWDLKTGQCLHTLEGHTNSVGVMALTPDGRRAVSASEDKTIRLWDLETGRPVRTLNNSNVRSVEAVYGALRFRLWVTPNGESGVSASFESLEIWDLQTGDIQYALALEQLGPLYDIGATTEAIRIVSGSTMPKFTVSDLKEVTH
jgi:hypothetical protein